MDMLTHQGTKALQTPRLTLDRFTPADAQAMYEGWARDPQVTRFLTWPPHPSAELTAQLLESWCARYAQADYYNWAIRREGCLIGNISVVALDERSQRAALGYCLSAAYWNQGCMTEAAQAVIDFLFQEVNVHRVEIAHAVKNPASGAVARKCGLTLEGVRREYFKAADGEYLDIAAYAILRQSWERRGKGTPRKGKAR